MTGRFVIRRDHGFEAGEYDLKIKREDDGVQMGQTIHLILKGDNPVVDRRSMTFEAKSKKTEKVDNGLDGGNIIRQPVYPTAQDYSSFVK